MSPTVADLPRFQQVQATFTRHMRDPGGAPAPADVEDRRMGIYRDLLYSNVEGFLAQGYPVLRRIHDDATWHALIRDYFRDHRAHTPYFPKMSGEFLRYLENERGARSGDFPFLRELAHYEWVETSLTFDVRRVDQPGVDPGGDLLAGVPVLSPLALPLSYRYPVHRIGPEYLPQEPPAEPTYLVVYRDRADQIGFLELNAVSARLVELLGANAGGARGRDLLRRIAVELNHPDPSVVERSGADILAGLRQRDIVSGVR